jgi:7-cyano-7-deazaguanine synthase
MGIQTSECAALVLLSGGVDSTAVLDYCIKQKLKPNAFFVDYGQLSARREKRAVTRICQIYNTQLSIGLVTGFKGLKDGYIRGRNGFLLYMALMAFDAPAGTISFGIHRSTTYADCSPVFVQNIQDTFDLYSNGTIKIHAPFIDWTKAEIWEYCKNNNVPIELTYSCELGLKQPCGKCLSCQDLEVINAF